MRSQKAYLPIVEETEENCEGTERAFKEKDRLVESALEIIRVFLDNYDCLESASGDLNAFLESISDNTKIIISERIFSYIQSGVWLEGRSLELQNLIVKSIRTLSDIDSNLSDLSSFSSSLSQIASEILFSTKKLISSTSLTLQPPDMSSFGDFFRVKQEELKKRLKILKIQFKLCPGVQLPPIRMGTKEVITQIRRPVTEWDHFTYNEKIDVEAQKICSFPLLGALCKISSNKVQEIVEYKPPLDWEVVRMSAHIVNGHFKSAQVQRTIVKDNVAYCEVEIKYSRLDDTPSWCLVRLEGLISRKKEINSEEVTYKPVLIIEDLSGDYELPEDLAEEFLES